MPQKILALCTDEQLGAVADGFACFRAGRFFAAHEHFERGFRTATPPLETLLRALAQLAASHYQLTLGRGRAAVRTWEKARAKLESVGCLPETFLVEVETFHARLGLSVEGPRFIDPARLGPAQSFPMLEAAMLHSPRA